MIKSSEFFLFSVFLWWFCGLWIATGLRPSQWQMRQRIVVYGLLRRFTPRNDKETRDSTPTSSLRLWNCHCETLQKGWESRYRDNRTQPTPSLRGLEKPVAISVWSTMTVKQNSSLRELLATRGNLSMEYNFIYSWNSFSFLFLCLLLVICGLLRFARNDEGVKGNDFFLFSVFIFTFCGLWIASSFHSSQWQRKNCHCENRRFVAIHNL